MSAYDFPICLRLEGRPVLLVGGGEIAIDRAEALLEAGAKLTVVATRAGEALHRLAAEGKLSLRERPFVAADLDGQALVFTAIDDRDASRAIAEEARARGLLINAADLPELCDFTLPAVGRKGPITIAISTAGAAPALAASLRTRFSGELRREHAWLARVSGWLRRNLPAGPARRRLLSELAALGPEAFGRARRRQVLARLRIQLSAMRPVASPALPPSEPVRAAGEAIPVTAVPRRVAFPSAGKGERHSARGAGKVFLIGAGPGDPELLTLKAAQVLKQADTVVYDRLIHAEVLVHARAGARLIFAGKTGGGESVPQAETNAVLIAQARLGRTVARLKSGDPFVFGRGGEEALALEEAGVPYEIVPGVSSGIAAPAAAGIPVTHRGLAASVTFATGRRAEGEPGWAHLAGAETLVLFMAKDTLADATRALIAQGKSPRTPAAVVEAGTWADQRVVEGELGDIALRAQRAQVGSPALLVVGEVVSLRSRLGSLARVAGAHVEVASVGGKDE